MIKFVDMTGKERLQAVLNHRNADRIALDFGGTNVTGMHCRVMEAVRKHYGLDEHPVYVYEPGQMLGLMEDDLAEALGIDTKGCFGKENNFGIANEDWKPFKMPWGQTIMFPARLADTISEKDGALFSYPQGDTTLPPSAKMPETCYFFDCIERQDGEIDDEKLNVEDNLEEFGEISDAGIEYWKKTVDEAAATGRAVVASFGGMALGDVARVITPALKHPKGIRSVAEWYMSTVIRQDYIHELFDRQTQIAVRNLEKLYAALGDKVDVVHICGTDFGTQVSQFCSVDTFRSLYMPYYQRMNNWIHEHTPWKTFKHSCGAVYPLMEGFIESGFDIINPVQIAAVDMEPGRLKKEFGDRITFWGGGVNTQTTLPFGTPDDVRKEVIELCGIFGRDGGFVFNSVHNIQANVPVENVVALFDTLKEIRK